MSNIEDRWIELQFYQFVKDLQEAHKDPLTLLDAIEAIAIYGKFSSTKIQKIVMDMLNWTHNRPAQEEMAILAHKANATIDEICRTSELERRTVYRVLKKELEEPRYFYPRLSQNQTKTVTQFMEALNRLRKAGIYGPGTVSETTSHAHSTWTKGIYSQPL